MVLPFRLAQIRTWQETRTDKPAGASSVLAPVFLSLCLPALLPSSSLLSRPPASSPLLFLSSFHGDRMFLEHSGGHADIKHECVPESGDAADGRMSARMAVEDTG